MHELPVTESIRDIALRHAEQASATKITDIYLVIGQLSSMVDDSIQFYWGLICKDTIAEAAKLHFRRIPAELTCLDCGQVYQPTEGELACPTCQGGRVRIDKGKEFFVESIEIETLPLAAEDQAQGKTAASMNP